jgi:hypothetical protein
VRFWIEDREFATEHTEFTERMQVAADAFFFLSLRPLPFQTEFDLTATDAMVRNGKTIPIPSAKICAICGSTLRLPPDPLSDFGLKKKIATEHTEFTERIQVAADAFFFLCVPLRPLRFQSNLI